MNLVTKCLKAIINEQTKAFAGKNISAQHDKWNDPEFLKKLELNDDIYKLRRKT